MGMDSGTSPETFANDRPTVFRVIFASCMLVSFLSAFAHTWALKFGDDYQQLGSKPFTQGVPNEELDVRWKPLELEKALYVDRGYGIGCLNTDIMAKIREKLPTMSPALELFVLRMSGVFSNLTEFFLIAAFAFCAGRSRYYDKTAAFEPVSSTLYFRAVRLTVFGIVLTWVWAALPFGVTIPGIGGLPILVDATGYHIGVVWASSPSLGFWPISAVTWIGIYLAAGNLRRLA